MGIWTRKQIEVIGIEPSEQGHLRRVLGPIQLVLLGIGAIIGAGLFSVTGIAAAQNAGPAIVLSFIIAAIGSAFAGLCYAEMTTMIPVAGSTYNYAYATLGQLLAWIIGWDLILEYAIGAATVSISWSAYAVSLMNDLGIPYKPQLFASPWQPVLMPDGTQAYGYINLPAVIIVVGLSLILIRGIQHAAFANAVMVILKVSVIILFIAVGVNYLQAENFVPFIPENTGIFGQFGWTGVMRGAGIVFFAYVGFDAVSTAAQEAKDPQKTLPIGILGSLAICTVLYVLFAFVLVGIVNYTKLGVAAPVAIAIDRTPYTWLNVLVKLAILAGFTSVILVMMLGQSRIFYSMAKDGLLPPLFADIHPRFHTPWRCNIALMAFVALFGAFAPLSLVGEMTSIGTLFAFVIVCTAVMILRVRHPEFVHSFRTPWVPFVPIMGILTCLSMMVSLGPSNWTRLFVWLAIGLIIYTFYGRKHAKLLVLLLCLTGCGPIDPSLTGRTSPSPEYQWVAPKSVSSKPCAFTECVCPGECSPVLNACELVDIGLRNNPQTQQTWYNARAAAFNVGTAQAALYPNILGTETLATSDTFGAGGLAGNASVGPNGIVTGSRARFNGGNQWLTSDISLSYLLLDFGGRCATIVQARDALWNANWTHNRMVQTVLPTF